MGLDYLNKKVWHPGSMKNIQKVWQAEQAKLQIIKKQKERAKKLQDEKHNEEMKRIQVEAGLIPRSHLDRMEWMYDWGSKMQQDRNSQAYLTGQKKPGKKEVKHIFQEQATNKKCQDFILLHQDPMYEIQKEEQKRKQAIMNNPIEMKNIIKEVEQNYLAMYPEDRKSRKQKDKKSKRRHGRSDSEESHRKKSKKRKHKRERSSSSSSRSNSSSRSREKKSSKQSSIYKEYLKNRFGGILTKDQSGNLRPDYNLHKKKYKTQIQIDEEERRKRLDEYRGNANRLRQMREDDDEPMEKREKEERNKSSYEESVGRMRANMFEKHMEREQKWKNKYD